jgi:hypothetical protein
MATEQQLVANRLNALASTGPHTPTETAVVSPNAITHVVLALRWVAGWRTAAGTASWRRSCRGPRDVTPRRTAHVDPRRLVRESGAGVGCLNWGTARTVV